MLLLEQLSVKEADRIREWCRNQPLVSLIQARAVSGRLEKWYRWGSNLRSISYGHAEVFQCEEPPMWLGRVGDNHLPGWNSLLVCGGPTSIDWHRDHGHFLGPAVMINLGEALFRESNLREPNSANVSSYEEHCLRDGMIIIIDTKRPHCSVQQSQERFNLTFRVIKRGFIPDSQQSK